MEPAGPVSQRTPLLRFVDALTLGGEQAPALLVQLESDWAAFALTPAPVLVVAIDARANPTWDDIVARAAGVRRTEQKDVLDGLA